VHVGISHIGASRKGFIGSPAEGVGEVIEWVLVFARQLRDWDVQDSCDLPPSLATRDRSPRRHVGACVGLLISTHHRWRDDESLGEILLGDAQTSAVSRQSGAAPHELFTHDHLDDDGLG
jgi:hypothetical protein